MNKTNEPTEHPSLEAATSAHAICEREEALRLDCGRLLRRELGFYLGNEQALHAFRIVRAMDELRQIQSELEQVLHELGIRN